MPDIRDITAAASYTGNAALGGGDFGVLNIDTKPIETLSYYTMLYHKSEQEQRKKETQAKVDELANLSALDLNKAIPNDKKEVLDTYNQLLDYARDYARQAPKTDSERIQSKLEFDAKLKKAKDLITSANGRYAGYQTHLAQINENPDIALRGILKKQLDDQANNSDVFTQIDPLPKYDLAFKQPPKPEGVKFETVQFAPNEAIIHGYEMANMHFIGAQSDLMQFDIVKDELNVNSDEFKNATPEQQQQYRTQNELKNAAKKNGWLAAKDVFNASINDPKYKTNGVIDVDKIKAAEGTGGIVSAIQQYNDYVTTRAQEIRSGVYKDQTGKPYLFDNKNLFEKDYQPINWQDGLSGSEFSKVIMLANWKGDGSTVKVQSTNDQVEQQRLANEREGLKIRWANYGLEKSKIDNADTKDLLAADGVLREVSDIINKGDMPENQVTVVDANTNNEKKVFKIGDPTILQKFANIDKDGKLTHIPDEARYNPKTNEIDLVYFSKTVDLLNPNVATVNKNKSGGNFIDEIKPLNARTWVNMVAQRSFGGSDKGKANEILQSIITKNGGDLYKIAKSLETPQPTKKIATTQTPSFKFDAQIKASDGNMYFRKGKKILDINGKDVTNLF